MAGREHPKEIKHEDLGAGLSRVHIEVRPGLTLRSEGNPEELQRMLDFVPTFEERKPKPPIEYSGEEESIEDILTRDFGERTPGELRRLRTTLAKAAKNR